MFVKIWLYYINMVTTLGSIMIENFLKGKLALITGASRGLGREMAVSLGDNGASIALVGRAEEKLKETQELIEERNIKSEIFVADISLESEVLNLKREVDAKMGDPDILINNAGTAIRKDVIEFGLNEWQNVINTNLTSAFMMSKAFSPYMIDSGWGRIINITSIMANVGSPGEVRTVRANQGFWHLPNAWLLSWQTPG